MPIEFAKRLLNMSDPFDDFVAHMHRVLSFIRTMLHDARKYDFVDIEAKARACKRIIGDQSGQNSQHIISLWREKFQQIHSLPRSRERTHLSAMQDEMKHWLEELIVKINTIHAAATEAKKIPKKSPQKPNLTQLIKEAEEPATKILARAKQIRLKIGSAKKQKSDEQQQKQQQQQPPQAHSRHQQMKKAA